MFNALAEHVPTVMESLEPAQAGSCGAIRSAIQHYTNASGQGTTMEMLMTNWGNFPIWSINMQENNSNTSRNTNVLFQRKGPLACVFSTLD